MNNLEFETLINLYFDQEISAAELKRLKKELAENVDRRREFQLRYRLHRVACAVLSAEASVVEQFSSDAPVVRRSGYKHSVIFGLGMAACFLILLTTITFTLPEQISEDAFIASRSTSPDEADYLENQKPEFSSHESLTSQFRLAGLTPDITPSGQKLTYVDTETLREKESHLKDMIRQIEPYQTYSALPEPQFIEPIERSYEANLNRYLPAGFQSSLASFK